MSERPPCKFIPGFDHADVIQSDSDVTIADTKRVFVPTACVSDTEDSIRVLMHKKRGQRRVTGQHQPITVQGRSHGVAGSLDQQDRHHDCAHEHKDLVAMQASLTCTRSSQGVSKPESPGGVSLPADLAQPVKRTMAESPGAVSDLPPGPASQGMGRGAAYELAGLLSRNPNSSVKSSERPSPRRSPTGVYGTGNTQVKARGRGLAIIEICKDVQRSQGCSSDHDLPNVNTSRDLEGVSQGSSWAALGLGRGVFGRSDVSSLAPVYSNPSSKASAPATGSCPRTRPASTPPNHFQASSRPSQPSLPKTANCQPAQSDNLSSDSGTDAPPVQKHLSRLPRTAQDEKAAGWESSRLSGQQEEPGLEGQGMKSPVTTSRKSPQTVRFSDTEDVFDLSQRYCTYVVAFAHDSDLSSLWFVYFLWCLILWCTDTQ